MFEFIRRVLTNSASVPDKWQGNPWFSLPFLAIDLELTSLDVNDAKILSIGWVESAHAQIDLNSCFYKVIRTHSSLNQSPIIHGLVEADIRLGEAEEDVLTKLLPFTESHIWVFHNTHLDMQVLSTAFSRCNKPLPEIVTLDTLQIALYLLRKRQSVLPPNAATLSACRQRYNLPFAPAHNALDDAMATVELLHALLFDLDPSGKCELRDFGQTGGLKTFKSAPLL